MNLKRKVKDNYSNGPFNCKRTRRKYNRKIKKKV